MRARAEAVAEFAATLRELRMSVGNPSFREMSGRSGAISHTTLHEATKGNRLPSWGTTAEFVKACGADPAEYRERWDTANLAVRSAGEQAPLAGVPVAHPPAEAAASGAELQAVRIIAIGPQPVDEDVPAPEGRGWLWPALLGGAVLVAAGVGVAIFVDRGSPPDRSASGAAPPPVCPVRAPQAVAARPAHAGDAARFVADVTLPDCSHVGPGRTVAKVWRLRNTGNVRWKGYSLLRLDLPQQADQCRTEVQVPIGDTRPGGTVDVRADVTTPEKPGLCYARFKMVDASGRIAFPGSRPVNFQVIVDRP
ncbi:hypothetical protein ACRB68_39570 [Actinomadura sp. RB68]|uniref:Nbr1 FW domain-containing protein n=2 Tax=Actinomadura macrotermitis TaxID=2585200 RepID=A0A7K0BXG3_9ACTN|nr:hypothetical protein [Actinomadura macrotermitis]